MAGMKERLRQAAAQAGLPMGEREMTFNSRRAQELAKWAESKGLGDAFHEAVFRAYYVEGMNIGKIDELARIAGSSGLDEKEARSALKNRTYEGAVDADWSRCRTLGITAVPTFMTGTRRIVGAVAYEVLERFISDAGAVKRAGEPH